MPKFVEGFAGKLVVPDGKTDVQVFDDELPGFGIRKFAGGHASYFVKFSIGTQQRRKTLGKVVRGNRKVITGSSSNASARLSAIRFASPAVTTRTGSRPSIVDTSGV